MPTPDTTPTPADDDRDLYAGGLRVAWEAGAHLSVYADSRVGVVEWMPRAPDDPMPWCTPGHRRHASAEVSVSLPGDSAEVPVTVAALVAAVRRDVPALDTLTVQPHPRHAGIFAVTMLRIKPDRRGQGHAGRVLRAVTRWAETFAATLVIPPGPGRPDRWYARHGFVPGPDATLVRFPATAHPDRPVVAAPPADTGAGVPRTA